VTALEELLVPLDARRVLGPQRLGRAARLTMIVITIVTAAVLPFSHRDLGRQAAFLPAILSIVFFVDLLSAYLLTLRFRDTGDIRVLLMASAYVWSCVVVVGYALSFPGLVGSHPPLDVWPSGTPWLYVLWHVGFPTLMALAAGLPEHRAAVIVDDVRARWAKLLLSSTVVVAVIVVFAVIEGGGWLPVVIVGVDTTRLTEIAGPPAMVIAISGAIIVYRRFARRPSGPERWVAVTAWVCVVDLLLTFWSLHRYSLGWYAGRTLTIVGSSLVFFAMLAEFTRMQHRLVTSRDDAVSAAIMQRNFAMSASHELRTPTTSILGYIEEVLDSDELSVTDRQLLDVAHRNTGRLCQLVDDLLILGRAEMGPTMMDIVPTALAPVVQAVVAFFSGAAQRQGVTLVIDTAEGMPMAMADGARTEQALTNLVSNALKFTGPNGEVRIGLCVVDSVGGAGDVEQLVQLSVSDTGVGIDPDEVGRVFERFYRSKAAVDTAIKGTGLGLAIVRTIVEAQHGDISVHSILGRGTTFCITLPVAADGRGAVRQPG
jgi:signal transduction histidine kinase